MEPFVDLEVRVPQEALGSVTGDLAGRRGRVAGTRSLPLGRIQVMAQAPLAELDDYPERLKAMTGGDATFTVELAGYEPVPEPRQRELCAAFRHEED
jgi:elongation factor G